MLKLLTRLTTLALLVLLVGCATTNTKDQSAQRTSKPRSIVVLPPLNNSPDMRASYSFLSTVTYPLAELGYYVFPVALVDQTFKENGLPNPGEMHQVAPQKLGEIFGADAALFITIEKYGATYQIISSSVIVSAKARLVDTRNGQIIWEGSASASSDENGGGSSGSLLGMVLSSLIQQVINNVGDKGYPIAKITSMRLLSAKPGGLLHGPRSPLYGTD